MLWAGFPFILERSPHTHRKTRKALPSSFCSSLFVKEKELLRVRERERAQGFFPHLLCPLLRLCACVCVCRLPWRWLLSAGPPELPVSISTPASPPQMLPLCPPYHRLLTSPETRMILLRPSQTQSSLSAGAEWRLSAARKEIPSFPLRFLFHFLTGNLAFLRRSPFYCLGIDFI